MTNSDALEQINKTKEKIKDHPVVIDVFEKYNIDTDEIDLVPVCFAELPVSARTDHGIIYLNNKLLNEDFEHYLVHELVHFCQQTSGSGPTKATNTDDYLFDKNEEEGFQAQVKYIKDTDGRGEAEEYVDKVLEHHDLDGAEAKNRKEKLMELAHIAGINIIK